MHDPHSLPFIAQNEQPGTNPPGEHHTDTTAAGGHNAPNTNTEVNPFVKLFGALGDHHEISFGNTTLVELPVILIDHGLHIYPSIEKMEEAGTYQYTEHHIYRKGTHESPALDLSITTMVAFQWITIAILLAILVPMARKYRRSGVRPMRGLFNVVELLIEYVRDEIVIPNAGPLGMKLLPVYLTFFFFILVANLLGTIPGGHAATSSINVTAGLAAIAFVVIQGASIRQHGVLNWIKHLTGGTHWAIWPIMVPVEVMGLFTKPFALCVRLFANMTAGHVMLLSLIGLVFVTAGFIPVTIAFSLFVNLLELLVIFLQAYIFTMLTAVFTGMGTAGGHDDKHGDKHDAESAWVS